MVQGEHEMKYRTFNKTGLTVSEIGIGTNRFGHNVDQKEVNKILSSSTDTTVTVLSCLLLVQDEIGYIPDDAVEEIASFLKTSINEVWGVATFYTNFRFTPPVSYTHLTLPTICSV